MDTSIYSYVFIGMKISGKYRFTKINLKTISINKPYSINSLIKTQRLNEYCYRSKGVTFCWKM